MPELQRWEEKAIGRVNRFENYTSELLVNRAYEGARAGINGIIKGLIWVGRQAVGSFLSPTKPQVVAGKKFTEKTMSFTWKLITKGGVAVANKVMDSTEKAADSFLTGQYFYPDPNTATNALFGGHITFDPELVRKTFNACGYEPRLDDMMSSLRTHAEAIEYGFTDITWREDVVPHIIRTVYQEELDKCLSYICADHLDKTTDVYNRQLMEARMHAAAQHLGELFEKFTLDLANKTDFLEAPITFLPKQPDPHTELNLSVEERALLADVPRLSMFANEKKLQTTIAAKLQNLPKLTAAEARQRFDYALSRQMVDSKGEETPYQKGINPAEDERRLVASVLNIRELKQQYENRNFFSRWLTRAGREERQTLAEMQQALSAQLGLEPEQMTTLLDLKIPLEKHVDIARVLDVPYMEKPEKTFSENVSQAIETVNIKVRDVTAATLDFIGKAIVTAKNAIVSLPQTVGSMFSGKQEEEKSPNQKENEKAPNTEPKEPKEPKPAPEKKESDQNSKKEDLKPEGLKQPDPKTEQKPKPEQEEPKPVESKKEEPNQEEPKPEELKAEEPKQESYGAWFWNVASSVTSAVTGAVTSTASYAASWLDPRNYNIFGGGSKADPQLLEQVQNRQKDVAKEIKDATDWSLVMCQGAFAKLLYYKTVEISLNKGMITAAMLPTVLSEENVTQGADQIKNDPAFKNLDKFQFKKGMAKELKAYLTTVSEDPSAVNELHKDYMQKKQEHIQAQNNPQPQKTIQQQAPEIAPAPKASKDPNIPVG